VANVVDKTDNLAQEPWFKSRINKIKARRLGGEKHLAWLLEARGISILYPEDRVKNNAWGEFIWVKSILFESGEQWLPP
jgi:hypothetical protein